MGKVVSPARRRINRSRRVPEKITLIFLERKLRMLNFGVPKEQRFSGSNN